MKLWLDDWREKPAEYDIHVKTAADAIAALERGGITEISLDYDLGKYDDEISDTGRAVAAWIARGAWDGTVPRMKWKIHSDNVQGREIMLRMLEQAERYWTENEMAEQPGEGM